MANAARGVGRFRGDELGGVTADENFAVAGDCLAALVPVALAADFAGPGFIAAATEGATVRGALDRAARNNASNPAPANNPMK